MSLVYTHPHVHVSVESVESTPVLSAGKTSLFVAFVGDKGEDRVLKRFSSPEEFLAEYFDNSKIDITRHGQAALNAWSWLQNGEVWALAVTNDDTTTNGGLNAAAYANSIYGIGFKKTTDDVVVSELQADGVTSVDVTYKAIEVKTRVRSIASKDATTLDKLLGKQTLVNSITNPFVVDPDFVYESFEQGATPDADGFYWFDFAAAYYKGRTEFGNKLGLRLSEVTNMKYSFPDNVIYSFDVVQKNTATDDVLRSYYVSINPEARNSGGETVYLTDIFNQYEQDVRVFGNSRFVEKVEEFMGAGFNASKMSVVSPKSWEESGKDEFKKAGYVVQTLVTAADGTTSVVSDRYNTFYASTDHSFTTPKYLKNGTRGVLSRQIVDRLLENAYTGTTNNLILDTDLIDIDVLLDANESVSVKAAMETLAQNRGDCICLGDFNFTRSYRECEVKRKSLNTANTEHVAYFAQDLIIKDPFYSRQIRVTSTYALAGKVAKNDVDYGISKNFVGPTRGVLSMNPDNVSWLPNDTQRETLYLNQINYILYDGSLYFDTQLTSRKDNTALSNISVTRALLRMKRLAKRAARSVKHEYFNEDVFGKISSDINFALDTFMKDGSTEELSISVYASKYDRVQKIVRVKISIKFTDIIERIAIAFSVKR